MMANKLQEQVHGLAHWPQSPEEVAAVREQLEKLLRDPLFSQSRRYPSLLRRIVEDSLAGNVDNLKERILGIELFHRTPDYDTNADAIVRVTAAEIRKRIAQYYHEEIHRTEPRIDLPVGGYVAEFSPARVEIETGAGAAVAEVAGDHSRQEKLSDPKDGQRHGSHLGMKLLAGCLVILLILAIAFWARYGSRNEVDEFWRPFTSNGALPLLCVGQLPVNTVPQGTPDSLARALLSQRPVSISDAVVVSDYATYFGSKEVRPRIQVSTTTSYTDLRQHPVLLVGGLDNSWTMRFLEGLRYRMRADPNSSILKIYDSTNASGQTWEMDFAKTPEHITDDYAIVSRFNAPATESTVVIAAGLGENGTAAAADFLLHSQYLNEIDQKSPAPWKNKNMELVIKTQIIDGNAGPPVIVARYFW